MALKAPPAPVVFTATQGSADAFVEASVSTGLSGNLAFNARQFQYQLKNASGLAGLGTDCEIQWSLTRRSKAAMPTLDDSDVIYKGGFVMAVVTSGIALLPTEGSFTPLVDIPIVEETLYLQLDSTGTAATLAICVVMSVESDSISDIERLRIISRSLQ